MKERKDTVASSKTQETAEVMWMVCAVGYDWNDGTSTCDVGFDDGTISWQQALGYAEVAY